METNDWRRLLKLIGCAWAVFASPPSHLPVAIMGCLTIPSHDA